MIPIKRSKHPPEYTARGVAIGIAWALTPSIGIQMVFCFITWLVAKKIFKWDFSVLIAMAWTWTTNVVTAIPSHIGLEMLLRKKTEESSADVQVMDE